MLLTAGLLQCRVHGGGEAWGLGLRLGLGLGLMQRVVRFVVCRGAAACLWTAAARAVANRVGLGCWRSQHRQRTLHTRPSPCATAQTVSMQWQHLKQDIINNNNNHFRCTSGVLARAAVIVPAARATHFVKAVERRKNRVLTFCGPCDAALHVCRRDETRV